MNKFKATVTLTDHQVKEILAQYLSVDSKSINFFLREEGQIDTYHVFGGATIVMDVGLPFAQRDPGNPPLDK